MDSYPNVPVGGLTGLVMVSTGFVGDDGLAESLFADPPAIAIVALILEL